MTAQILLFPIANKRRAELEQAVRVAALADWEKETLAIFCERGQNVKSWLDI